MNIRRTIGFLLILAAAAWVPVAAKDAFFPDELDGLEGWYEADALRILLSDGNLVANWPDSSGNGHHLVFDGEGKASVYREKVINDLPAVEVRKGNRYAVTEPFDLQEHTIFLVHRSSFSKRVLFRSDRNAGRGLVLHVQGRQHAFRNGEVGSEQAAYTNEAPHGREFGITVLGRQAGVFRAFVDGGDISSGRRFTDRLRVASFFDLYYSKHVSGDGQGLWIAEMLFYDRFLAEAERQAVETYLSEKYDLRLTRRSLPLKERLDGLLPAEEATVAWLTGGKAEDVNREEGQRVVWDKAKWLGDTFRRDTEKHGSRLYCTKDGQRVRLYVVLGLQATRPGVAIRMLFLKNGETYLADETTSAPFTGEGDELESVVELESTVFLDADDYVEVLTFRDGDDGPVSLLPGAAVWVAEAE